jgi:hypothetical protein
MAQQLCTGILPVGREKSGLSRSWTEMTYPHINPKLKAKIKSIVVKEFSGIDHLPNDIAILISQ